MSDSRRRSGARPRRGALMTATGMLTAVVATTIVVRGGDAAFTTGDDDGPPTTRTVVATPGPRTPSAPATAVTVTAPAEVPVTVAPSGVSATPEALSLVDARRVTYTVAGNQRPDDPVTVTYADDTGALRTVENVALPWTLTVVPQVPVNYVTASSFGSQLNCWITDAAGATVASAVDNSTATTCNR